MLRDRADGALTVLQLRKLLHLMIDQSEDGTVPEAVELSVSETKQLHSQMADWRRKSATLASEMQGNRYLALRLERLYRYTSIVGSSLLLTHPSWFSGSFPSKAAQLDFVMQRSLDCAASLAGWLYGRGLAPAWDHDRERWERHAREVDDGQAGKGSKMRCAPFSRWHEKKDPLECNLQLRIESGRFTRLIDFNDLVHTKRCAEPLPMLSDDNSAAAYTLALLVRMQDADSGKREYVEFRCSRDMRTPERFDERRLEQERRSARNTAGL